MKQAFPAASNGDFEAVKAVADAIKDSTVCGLARATEADIRRAGEALQGAGSARIHTFIATSPIHMEKKLRMSPDQVMEQAVKAVKWARQYTDDVEFSPEDAGRSDITFLCRILEAVINAGATTLNIPDTVGYTMPEQFGKLIHTLRERIPNSDKVVFSVHCHNDLGIGGGKFIVSSNERSATGGMHYKRPGRAGRQCSLEEIVMAVRTRQDFFPCDTRIDTVHIVPASKLVSGITGFPVQPNKAIVGANAFAHESGIHQDGVLKHRETYEIMRAEDVGWGANKLLLGKHSGRNAFRSRLAELGIELESEEVLNATFMRFKELADKKHDIFDEDLHALVSDDAMTLQEHYKLLSLTAHSETGETPHASIVISEEGKESRAESDGSGPVDATFRAIEKIVVSGVELQLFSVNAITSGTDSQGEVTVRLQKSGRIVNGNGADTDIVVASAKAYLSALNKLHSKLERAHPQV